VKGTRLKHTGKLGNQAKQISPKRLGTFGRSFWNLSADNFA
jgi:hypothetical protein